MEQQISGREIMLFITMFKLWDAYVEADNHPAGSLELRSPGFGCDECSYTLYNNGQYEIEAWVPEEDESCKLYNNGQYEIWVPEEDKGNWELVQLGSIFDEVNV